MKLKDIAKEGLKGRRKDTLLLKLVITLAFIFIVSSTIFEGSIIKTKEEQRLDLYGQWHAAYLKGDEETLKGLESEEDIDRLGVSLIIGESEDCGVVGTFNEDLIDMGRFTLYKGRYPESPDEIMLELNQMSLMNLDLEVGQKIQLAIPIQRVEQGYKDYILGKNREFEDRKTNMPMPDYERLGELQLEVYSLREIVPLDEKGKKELEEKIRELEIEIDEIYDQDFNLFSLPKYYQYNETPFEKVGDVSLVVNNNYFYYYLPGDESNPDIFREEGLLTSSRVILKKEFVVSGIIQTYTDKWDLGGFKSPNAFITEEGGKTLTHAFYNNNLGDFSDYKMDYNIFLYSDSMKDDLYSSLAPKYPDMNLVQEDQTEIIEGFDFWIRMYRMTDKEIDNFIKSTTSWSVGRVPEDWRDDSLESKEEIGSIMEVNTSNFRRNNFSYPDDALSTEYVLTLTIIAVIFIATALAIFQIFLTQMKRRSRKLVLLKSIGATKQQIMGIIFHEGLYLLRTGLLVGLPAGFALAALIIFFMNNFADRNISFNIIPSLLILGIIAGCFALFLGMLVPMIYAIRIPLVGSLSKPSKHKKIGPRQVKGIYKTQTLRQINWQYLKLNRFKNLISFGISLISITILLITVLLSYISFDNYRDTVIIKNRPDYAMEAYFGAAGRGIKSMEEDLLAIDEIESTQVYKVGKQVFLWHEDLEENQMVKNFEELLPGKFRTAHFSRYMDGLDIYPEWINNALFTKIYGIDPESDLFNKYSSLVKDGTIDKESFSEGEEVILLIPLYYQSGEDIKLTPFNERLVLDATNEDSRMSWLFEQTGHYGISYSNRFKDSYEKLDYIKPGDKVYLSTDKEEIVGDAYVLDFRTEEFEVGGIIYYFDKQEIWPFSNNTAPYAIIGSNSAMEKLYPNSKMGLGMVDFDQMRTMTNTLYPTKYGRTLWYLDTDTVGKDLVLDAKLLSYANNNGYTLYNYKESNSELYSEGLNNTIIIGLLGFTAASLATIILYNILVSKLDQDKNRIGILQALGVSKRDFSKHYLQLGIVTALIAIIIANLLIFIILLLTSMLSTGRIDFTLMDNIRDTFEFRLWQYPWVLHIILNILFFAVTVLMYYLPSIRIVQSSPVENIRALSR